VTAGFEFFIGRACGLEVTTHRVADIGGRARPLSNPYVALRLNRLDDRAAPLSGLRNRISEFPGGIEPKSDRFLRIR